MHGIIFLMPILQINLYPFRLMSYRITELWIYIPIFHLPPTAQKKVTNEDCITKFTMRLALYFLFLEKEKKT